MNWTPAEIATHRVRAELCESVTLPRDLFMSLLDQLDLRAERVSCLHNALGFVITKYDEEIRAEYEGGKIEKVRYSEINTAREILAATKPS